VQRGRVVKVRGVDLRGVEAQVDDISDDGVDVGPYDICRCGQSERRRLLGRWE